MKREYLKTAKMPIVLKADGLALGKGVLICNTREEAMEGVKTLMLDKQFGAAGDTIVVEEFMTGREVSVLTFVDGNTYRVMTSAQDHKRAKDGDQGLNTGGMGTFSPSPFYTKEVDAYCREHIYQPTVDAMRSEGRTFQGIIFFGLMLTKEGPKVYQRKSLGGIFIAAAMSLRCARMRFRHAAALSKPRRAHRHVRWYQKYCSIS